MELFDKYARYYDLLYRDKDYEAESGHVQELIGKYSPKAEAILEFGCGTGRHSAILAEKGFRVVGVDLSDTMLDEARARMNGLHRKELSYVQGDMRTYSDGRSYDVVLALFHVVCYLNANKDLSDAFRTVRRHLRPGGVFIFDCWYGPAVLTIRPDTRIKRLENEAIELVRLAEPHLDWNRNCVDVHYQVLVMDKASRTVEQLHERHRMRYLFLPEIEQFLADAGMSVCFAQEWLTGKPPAADTWSLCVGGRIR